MDSHNPILIYEDTAKSVEVRLDTDRETVWLSQRQMADVTAVRGKFRGPLEIG